MAKSRSRRNRAEGQAGSRQSLPTQSGRADWVRSERAKLILLAVIPMLLLDLLVCVRFWNYPDRGFRPTGDTPYYTVAAANLYWHKGFAYCNDQKAFSGATAEELAGLESQPAQPTLDREPVYPFLMSLAFRIFGFEYSSFTRFNAIFLFPLNNLFLYLLARRLSRNRLVALLTLYLNTALNGPSVAQITAPVLPVSTFLVATTWFFVRSLENRRRVNGYAITGVLLGFCALTRFLYFLFWPIGLVMIAVRLYRNPRRMILAGVLFVTPVLLINGAWVLRNRIVFGEYYHTWRGGLNLLLRVEDRGRPNLNVPTTREWAEQQLGRQIPDSQWTRIGSDKVHMRIARQRIKDYPVRYATYLLPPIVNLWNPRYLLDEPRYVVSSILELPLRYLLVVPLYLYFLVGAAFLFILAVRRSWMLPAMLLVFPLFVTLAHCYLTPVADWWFLAYAWPFIYLVASAGIVFGVQTVVRACQGRPALPEVESLPFVDYATAEAPLSTRE